MRSKEQVERFSLDRSQGTSIIIELGKLKRWVLMQIHSGMWQEGEGVFSDVMHFLYEMDVKVIP